MTTMYFLQEFLLVLWFLSKIVSSINEGILQFSHSSLIVHENQRRVQLTVTRTCSESLLGYCSGSISVAYSTETKPTVRLPGNLVVRQGSAVVYSTTDLRRFLGRGDTLRLVDNTSRKMEYLDTTSIVSDNHDKNFNTSMFFLGSDYKGDRQYASVRRIRVRLPGKNSHLVLPGSQYVVTAVDLRQYVSRGDRLRIGAEMFLVSEDLERNFTSSYLPLDRTFLAHVPGGHGFSCLPPIIRDFRWRCTVYTDRIYKGLTVTGGNEAPVTVKIHAAQGSKEIVTSNDVHNEVSSGDFLKIDGITYIVDKLSSDKTYGHHNIVLRTKFRHQSCHTSGCPYVGFAMKETVEQLLPGTACAVKGSKEVKTTHDVQDRLSLGDYVKVGDHLAKVDDLGRNTEAGYSITAHKIVISPAYPHSSSCSLYLKTNAKYTLLNGHVSVKHGSRYIRTTNDLRSEIFRGERIKLGIRNYKISSSLMGLTERTFPLSEPYYGFQKINVVGFYAAPSFATSASKKLDYIPRTDRLVFNHGQPRAVIQILINNDDISEHDEVLRVQLYDPRYEHLHARANGLELLKRGSFEWSVLNQNSSKVEIEILPSKNLMTELFVDDHVMIGGFGYVIKNINESVIVITGNVRPQKNVSHSIYKLNPPLGKERTVDITITEDNTLVAQSILPGHLTFSEHGNKIQTSMDLTGHLQRGDHVIYENVDDGKSVGIVTAINAEELTLNVQNHSSSPKHMTSRAYFGSTRDRPGEVLFESSSISILESKHSVYDLGLSLLPGKFSGIQNADYVSAQKDVYIELAVGSSINIGNEKYKVLRTQRNKIYISPSFQGTTATIYDAFVDRNSGWGYATVSRISGSNGKIKCYIMTCDGYQDSNQCPQNNYQNIATSDRYSGSTLFLPGHASIIAQNLPTLRIYQKTDWNIYSGDIVLIDGSLYSVCLVDLQNGCVFNATHITLADVHNYTMPNAIYSSEQDPFDTFQVQKLTHVLPGHFLLLSKPSKKFFFNRRFDGLFDTRDPIKIGNGIYSNISLSKHDPLGELPGKVNVTPGFLFVESSVDLRPGYTQLLTCTAHGGSFQLGFDGFQTENIAWNSSIFTVLESLIKLPAIVSIEVVNEYQLGYHNFCNTPGSPKKTFWVQFLIVSYHYHEVLPRLTATTDSLQMNKIDGLGVLRVELPIFLQRSDYFWVAGFNNDENWKLAFQVHPTKPYNRTHIPIVSSVNETCISCAAERVGILTFQSSQEETNVSETQLVVKGYYFFSSSLLGITAKYLLRSSFLKSNTDARLGFRQEFFCNANHGYFRLGHGNIISGKIPHNASTEVFRAVVEEFPDILDAEIHFYGNRRTLCSPRDVSAGAASKDFGRTLITIKRLISLSETFRSFYIYESHRLSIHGNISNIRINSMPGLKRGDAIMLNNFITTVSYNDEFNASHIPIDKTPGEILSGELKRYGSDIENNDADYNLLSNTNAVVLENGVRSKTFPVRILDDLTVEEPEFIPLVVHNVEAMCVSSPCIYMQAFFCSTSTHGHVRFGLWNYWSQNISTMATIEELSSALVKLPDLVNVEVSNNNDLGLICSNDIVANIITLSFGSITHKPPPLLRVDGFFVDDDFNIFMKMVSPPPGEVDQGWQPSISRTQNVTTIHILEDSDSGGVFSFVKTQIFVNEGDNTIFLEVVRQGGCGGTVLAHFSCFDISAVSATAQGDPRLGHYSCPQHPLVFAHGVENNVFPIKIMDGPSFAGNLSFRVVLTSISGQNASRHIQNTSAIVTIIDDDILGQQVGFSKRFFNITNNNDCASIVIERNHPQSSISINVTSEGYSMPGFIPAVIGIDFTEYTTLIQFGEGQKSIAFCHRVLPNRKLYSQPRLIKLTLAHTYDSRGYSLNPVEAFIVINNDELNMVASIGFVYKEVRVFENSSEIGIPIEKRGGSNIPISILVSTVEISVPNGATPCKMRERGSCDKLSYDYHYQNISLTFEPDVYIRTIMIPIFNDVHFEAEYELFGVTLEILSGMASLGTGDFKTGSLLYSSMNVSVMDDGDQPGFFGFSSPNINVRENEGLATVTVTRTGGSSGHISITYASCNLNPSSPRLDDKIWNACNQMETTAKNGKKDHVAADYAAVYGTLEFEEGVSRMTFGVPIFDDACRDPEVIEVRLLDATLHNQPNASTCLNVNPDKCWGILEKERRSLIYIEDPEDPPRSHIASLALQNDPSYLSKPYSTLYINQSSSEVWNFSLVLSDSMSSAATTPLSNTFSLSDLKQALENNPLVAGHVGVRQMSTQSWLIQFDAFGTSYIKIVSTTNESMAIVKNMNSEKAFYRVRERFSSKAVIEARNSCREKIQLSTGTVFASLKTYYSNSCIQRGRTNTVEKQVVSIRPFLKMDGAIQIIKGLQGILISRDPKDFVFENYVFSRPSRSKVDEVLLGPQNAETSAGLMFKLFGVASLHSGTAVITVDGPVKLQSKLIRGDKVVLSGGSRFTVKNVRKSAIEISSIYLGESLLKVDIFRVPTIYTLSGRTLKLPGKYGATLNSSTVYCSEDLQSLNILQKYDVIKLYESEYTVNSVKYDSDARWTEITLSSVFNTGLCDGKSCKSIDWSAIDAYLVRGGGGAFWPIGFNEIVDSHNESFSLYRSPEVGHAKATKGSNVLQTASSKPFQLVKPGMEIQIKSLNFTIIELLDGNRTIKLNKAYTGVTSSSILIYALTNFEDRSILRGAYSMSLSPYNSTFSIVYGHSASLLKQNIQSFFNGNAKLRVSKSLFCGGYKYTINILYPSSNINQLKLDFSALRGLFYASISTASDGGNFDYVQADSHGLLNLPISGSKCGNLLGTLSANFSNGKAEFSDLRLDVSSSGQFLRFYTDAIGPVTGPFYDHLPPSGGIFVDSALLRVYETEVQRLALVTEPRWAFSGSKFGQPPVIHAMDSVVGGQRVFNDNVTKIKVSITLNQDGLGGGKLISLADDAIKLPFTISATKNSSTIYIQNYSSSNGKQLKEGDVIMIFDGTKNSTHQIKSLAGSSRRSCICPGTNDIDYCDSLEKSLANSIPEIQNIKLESGLNESNPTTNKSYTMRLRVAGWDIGRFAMERETECTTSSSEPTCCSKQDLFPVKEEVTKGTCVNLIQSAIQSALDSLKEKISFFGKGVNSEVIVKENEHYRSWTISVLSLRKSSLFGGIIGNLVPIKVLQDDESCCCSSSQCSNDVEGFVETISDGSGEIKPTEIQAIYAFGSASVAEIGGNFTISLKGVISQVEIFPTTPSSSKQPTLSPDNSMQKAIERLPGIVPPVEVVIGQTSSVGTMWLINFKSNVGDVPQIEISGKNTCRLVTHAPNEPTLFNTATGGRGENVIRIGTNTPSDNNGLLYDYWKGKNNHVGERIQFGSYDTAYDIYTVVNYDTAKKTITLDKPIVTDLLNTGILWCPSFEDSGTAGNNTYVFSTTVRNGSSSTTIVPPFDGESGQYLSVFSPETVIRTMKQGRVELDDIAILPLFKDMSKFNFKSTDEVRGAFRSPLYSLHFTVVGKPGCVNATSSYFTVLSNAVISLKAFSYMQEIVIDGKEVVHDSSYVAQTYFAESNSKKGEKSLQFFVGTEETGDESSEILSSTGFHTIVSAALIRRNNSRSASMLYGYTKKQMNEFCDPCGDSSINKFNKFWCQGRTMVAKFDDLQISSSGKALIRVFGSYESSDKQALIYSLHCSQNNVSSGFGVYLNEDFVAYVNNSTSLSDLQRAFNSVVGIDHAAIVTADRSTVCGSKEVDPVVYVVILKWSVSLFDPTSETVARLRASHPSRVRVGKLWSDIFVQVKEPSENSPLPDFNGGVKLRPYASSLGRIFISGTDSNIRVIVSPQYTTTDNFFDIIASVFDSTGKMSTSPSERPLCAQYREFCSSATTESKLKCAYYYSCGDTELPRKFKLHFWTPPKSRRLCGNVNVTQNSSHIKTSESMTSQIKVGQNLQIYNEALTLLTNYYVTAIDGNGIALDRPYDELDLQNGVSRDTMLYTRVSDASVLSQRSILQVTNNTHSLVHFKNISLQKAVTGLKFEVVDITCYLFKNVTVYNVSGGAQPSFYMAEADKSKIWPEKEFVEVEHYSTTEAANKNISAMFPLLHADEVTVLDNPLHSLEAGNRIYLPLAKKTLTILKPLVPKENALTAQIPQNFKYYSFEEVEEFAGVRSLSEEKACVQFDPFFSVIFVAETNTVLDSGYFTFVVEMHGSREETSKIYYSALSLSAFLRRIKNALEALPHVDEVYVTSATRDDNYFVQETKFFITFPRVRSKISLIVKDRYLKQGPAPLTIIPQHTGYSVTGKHNDGLYASKSHELPVSLGVSGLKISREAKGSSVNTPPVIPLRVSVVDSRGLTVVGGNHTLKARVLKNGRVQTFLCSAHSGSFRIAINISRNSLPIETERVAFDATAVDLQSALRRAYVHVATALTISGTSTLKNVNYINKKFVYVNDELLISTTACTGGTGSVYTVVNVMVDIELQHTINQTQEVNICKRVFPNALVVMRGSQRFICSSKGQQPGAVLVQFGKNSNIFIDSYPTLKVVDSTLEGDNGRRQIIQCTSTSARFRLLYRNIATDILHAENATSITLSSQLNRISAVGNVQVIPNSGLICSTTKKNFTIIFKNNPGFDHSDPPNVLRSEFFRTLSLNSEGSDNGSVKIYTDKVNDTVKFIRADVGHIFSGALSVTKLGSSTFEKLAVHPIGFYSFRIHLGNETVLKQTIVCVADGGRFYIQFNGGVTGPLAADISAQAFENALENLDSIEDVYVHYSYGTELCRGENDGENIAIVTFISLYVDGVLKKSENLHFLPLLNVPRADLYKCKKRFNGTGTFLVQKLYVDSARPLQVTRGQPHHINVQMELENISVHGGSLFQSQPVIRVCDKRGGLVPFAIGRVRAELMHTNRVQILRCDATSGFFRLQFNHEISSKIIHDASAVEIRNALKSIKSIANVDVNIYENGTSRVYNKACSLGGKTEIVLDIVSIKCGLTPPVIFPGCNESTSIVPKVKPIYSHKQLLGGRQNIDVATSSNCTLLGNTSVSIMNGVAVFHDLAVDKRMYKLFLKFWVEDRPFIRPTFSNKFDVKWGSVKFLRFLSLPKNLEINVSSYVEVELTDVGGNLLISDMLSKHRVTMSSYNSSFPNFAATVSSVGGVSIFKVLPLDAAHDVMLRFTLENHPKVKSLVSPLLPVVGTSTFLKFIQNTENVFLANDVSVQNGSMFVQASSGTSLSTNLSRGDAFALGNHSASNYTVYFVHETNYFDSSTIPLHQPFSGESSSKVSIQKVAVGGSPIPSQPIVQVFDRSWNAVRHDSASFVSATLTPTIGAIRPSCAGSIYGGSNRIQTISCVASSGSEGFTISFLREVSPLIDINANETAINNIIMSMKSVVKATVRIFKVRENNFFGSENVTLLPANTACTENGTSAIRIYFDKVLNHADNDALPLVKPSYAWTQVLICDFNAVVNANVTSFSFAYKSAVSESIPISAPGRVLKQSLETLDEIESVDLTFSAGNTFCTSNESNKLFVTFVSVTSLSLTVPLLKVTATNPGYESSDPIFSVRRVTFLNKHSYRNEFHVSGSHHVPVKGGYASFDGFENRLVIDKSCQFTSYQILLSLSTSRFSSTVTTLASKPIYVHNGSPQALKVITQPSGAASWPIGADGSLPKLLIMPKVALIDGGGNIATAFTGCILKAFLSSEFTLANGVMEKLSGTSHISSEYGIFSYENASLSLKYPGRIFTMEFKVIAHEDPVLFTEKGHRYSTNSCVGGGSKLSVKSNFFHVSGKPHYLKMKTQPPALVKSGDPFQIRFEILDLNKKPVIHYNEEKNISIFLHQEDNIRCPLFCAKLDVNSTDHVNIDITRGIVTFRAVVINLPLGTLSSLVRPVYIPEIHIITLSNPRKGSFRLQINFDELDPFVNSYLTRPIQWDAPASLNDENYANNTGNNSIGESLQSKIQAMPYIGRVIVSRQDLFDEQGEMSFRKWYITYTSYVGNLPILSLHSTYNMPRNSSLSAETGAQGKAYVLTAILSSGESGPLREIRTRGFKVEP